MLLRAVTCTVAFAATANAGILDLELTDVGVTDVSFEGSYWEIEFSYTVMNVGGVTFDPEGPNHNIDFDNAGIQTYLWDNAGGVFFAASGWSILDAPVIAPGESFSGSFTANSIELPDPTEFGDNTWLVIDLISTGEEPEYMGNNRALAHIPAPGAAALVGLGVVAGIRRRR